MKTQQLTLCLANRRGALADAVRLLSAQKINIQAMSVADTVDTGLVRIVTDRPAAAASALAKAKVPFTVQEVAIVCLKDRVGALADLTAKLAKAGVNIHYVYGSACSCGCDCESRLVVGADNLKKVLALAQ